MNKLYKLEDMKKYIFLLILSIVCGTGNVLYAATGIIVNRSQSVDDPVYFNLVKVESDIISINQYEYNYIVLYSDGRYKCSTKSGGKIISSSGYYNIDVNNHTISIMTEDRIPFYFIAPNEHTYINANCIIITGTLYGNIIRFEYRPMQ